MNYLKISILVCTLNEEKNIRNRLLNLKNLKLPNKLLLDIHVLDNNSKDMTLDIAGDISKKDPDQISIHNLGAIGKCGSLFWAFKNLKADYFLLTDANTLFSVNILEELLGQIYKLPEASVFVGNFRTFSKYSDGLKFIGFVQKMAGRLRLEKVLKVFTGANGGCYCVKSSALESIWNCKALRNDDFAISMYAYTNGSVVYLPNAKAYEIEDLGLLDLFHQKYRDALGHPQAIYWIIKNSFSVKSLVAVFFRMLYWVAPGLLFLYLLIFFGLYFIAPLTFAIIINTYLRKTIIKVIALYFGFIIGCLAAPPVSWIPIR